MHWASRTLPEIILPHLCTRLQQQQQRQPRILQIEMHRAQQRISLYHLWSSRS